MLGRADLTVSFNGIVTEMVITDELIGFKKHRKRKSRKLAPNVFGEEICYWDKTPHYKCFTKGMEKPQTVRSGFWFFFLSFIKAFDVN